MNLSWMRINRCCCNPEGLLLGFGVVGRRVTTGGLTG
jgi:hypothetical protein